MDYIGTATYSPEDNKLRLYPFSRLDKDTYDIVRANGFIWAPKQGLFVAPMWTPNREDLLTNLCGEIGDEDKTLVERAEERAERFDNYSENRNKDAERATEAVKAIADNIPFGQPILIGHHSEKRARRDAQKIGNGMRHAVKMWETSEYWERRAAGAIHNAKYKERPDVRARRIKKIEAEKRKRERNKAESEKWLKLWTAEDLTLEKARAIANYCHLSVMKREDNMYWTAYDVLEPDETRYKNCPAWTIEQVREAARKAYPRNIARCNRWINHYENRLTYERAMMVESGGIAADKTKPEKGGACKCWVSGKEWTEIVKVNRVSVTVMDNWGNGGPDFPRKVPFDKLKAVMSKAEYESYKRGDIQAEEEEAPRPAPRETETNKDLEAMRETLAAGIKTVTAPQLFPTPAEIAENMVELAGIEEGEKILEPSAGTGNILKAIGNRQNITAIELNCQLVEMLKTNFPDVETTQGDFLEHSGEYDVIIMNPPFERGEDIKHIKHALSMLAPGGRLVALCANGPRQQKQFKDTADYWEDLPEGSFSSQGTGVNVALMVIKSEAQTEARPTASIELGEQIQMF